MIQFNCANCQKQYRVKDNYQGRRVRCKSCGVINQIPYKESEKVGCGNSLAAYNQLLKALPDC